MVITTASHILATAGAASAGSGSAAAAAAVSRLFGLRNVTLEAEAARVQVTEQLLVHTAAAQALDVHRSLREGLDSAVVVAELRAGQAKDEYDRFSRKVSQLQSEVSDKEMEIAIQKRMVEELQIMESKQRAEYHSLERGVFGTIGALNNSDDNLAAQRAWQQYDFCRRELQKQRKLITDGESLLKGMRMQLHHLTEGQKVSGGALNTAQLQLSSAQERRDRQAPVLDRTVRRAEQKLQAELEVLTRLQEALHSIQAEIADADVEVPMLCRLATIPEKYLQRDGAGAVKKCKLRFTQLCQEIQMSWCVASSSSSYTQAAKENKLPEHAGTSSIQDFLATAPARVVNRLSKLGRSGPFLFQVEEKDDNPARYIQMGAHLLIKLNSPSMLASPQKLNFFELLRASYGDPQFEDVRLHPSPPDFYERALGLDRFRDISPPKALQPVLRPYQVAGFRWLASLVGNGLGAVLADDMGLGKTIQAISLLLYLHEQELLTNLDGRPTPALVVVPPGLLANWQREFKQWAKELRIHRYHGPGRKLPKLGSGDADVVLTTYQVVRMDRNLLSDPRVASFSCMIIDEAQNIKNHAALVTQAIKEVGNAIGHTRVALSGTPVENKVEELHSIFDYVNYGYLGDRASFLRDFSKNIEQSKDAAKRSDCLDLLNRLTKPFQLRRLKTDKSILPDLPEKIEFSVEVELTKEQQRLYEAVQEDWKVTMERSRVEATNHAFQRRGHIFAMLEKVRRICSHPHCLPRWPATCADLKCAKTASTSGKTARLLEILDDIIPSGEKVVIFVMRKAVLELLKELISQHFKSQKVEPLTFSGDIAFKQREAIAERFSTMPCCSVLLITVQAGGVGLNLTAANHVIHFDRCYNPAKEAQATDRCHRIGQKQVVCVHRFITQGTYEERLEEIMQRKAELSSVTITAAEDWIAAYDDDQLFNLFMLRSGTEKKARKRTIKDVQEPATSSQVLATDATPTKKARTAANPPKAVSSPPRKPVASATSSTMKKWKQDALSRYESTSTQADIEEGQLCDQSKRSKGKGQGGAKSSKPSKVGLAKTSSTSSSSWMGIEVFDVEEPVSVVEEVEECAICMDAPGNVLLLPCRHRSLCPDCAPKVQSCPLCREVISERQMP